ncbi:MAG: hypothetical protein HDS35_07715, partial [Bacteroides sp.]|nr:hypothetical protein [Bacteroides sp.]
MKKFNVLKIFLIAVAIVAAFSVSAADGKRIVGYVTSWGKTLPDPKLLTN